MNIINSLIRLLWYGYNLSDKNIIQKISNESENESKNNHPIIQNFQSHSKIIHLDEHSLFSRQELFDLIMKSKDHLNMKFFIHKYHSNYLLCYFLFDLLDLLSNECSEIQTNFEFILETNNKKQEFIKEIKLFLKSRLVEINKKKIIPIYSKFLEPFSLEIEYCLISNHKFNVLYLKESEQSLFIQRIYFSIDL
jgi:hypothetical protein